MGLDIILLTLVIFAAVWAVVDRSLLKSAIGLAVISIIITIFMFKFNSPLAAVFELSVCTGLITVIFLSTIALTKPKTHKEILAMSKDRLRRYGYLPIVVIFCGIASLMLLSVPIGLKLLYRINETDVRNVLWNLRHLDLFGQVIVLLAGGFGAVILFKEAEDNEW